MRKHNILRCLGLVFTWFMVTGTLQGQVVRERFDKLTISENFDSISTYWTTLANAENLFIVQDGEYILQRRASSAPYAIIGNFQEEFTNFRMVVSMKLDKSMGEGATVGILFMMQKDGQGGFLFEINKKKEYRIRQIAGGSYRYITGTSKDGGWVKNNAINEPNMANMIEIKCFNRSYDIYSNTVFLRSITEPSYGTGQMGLIIGPESRGKIDFIYIFTKANPAEPSASSAQSKGNEHTQQGPDIIELAESIIALKTQINQLQEDNDDLKKTISAMKSGEQEKDVTFRNFEKQITALQQELKQKDLSIDSLKRSNTDLLKYKEMVGGNDNGDLVINLSKALKAEKEKNLQLESELKKLRGDGKSTTPANEPRNNKNGSDSGEKNNNTNGSNVFSLPKDK